MKVLFAIAVFFVAVVGLTARCAGHPGLCLGLWRRHHG